MSTTLASPPPLPQRPPDHTDKVRGYAAARRTFLTRGAVRRTAAVALALVITAVTADVFLGLPAVLRALLLGAIAITAAVLIARWWWRPVHALDDAAAAREVERGFPILGQRLRTLREIESSPASRRAAPQLAGALAEDTRRRMAKLDPQALIPWDTLRRPLIACIAATALFLVLLAAWPEFRTGTARLALPGARISFTKVMIENTPETFTDRENPLIVARLSGRPAADATLFFREEGGEWTSVQMVRADAAQRFDALLTGRTKSFDYYVTAGDGRSKERHMRCLVTPKVEKASAELQLPEYTGVPLQHSEGGDVRAVEETQVRVTFQLNHALTSAGARLPDGRELPVTIAGNQLILETTLARGEFVYQLHGRDAEGIELAPTSYKLVGVEDKLPEVQLLEPSKDLEATTVWEIVARARAKDDFGVAKIGIILTVGDEMKIVAQREFSEKEMREVTEMGTALLEEFPLAITDNLKLYAYAFDHKPREGARAVSPLLAVDIRQFKTRWALMTGSAPPMSGNQLQEMLNLIREQRRVVSDVFVLKENGAPADGDLASIADKIAAREDNIAERALALKEEVELAGTMSRDDLVLLDTAAQQMGEASKHLSSRLLRPAYRQADAALSSLLAMKKLIMKLMAQRQHPTPAPSEEQEKQKSLSDLAAEAERLAREEREIRGKVAPEGAEGHELEMTRHQQDVALTDAGELYASLVAHPQATELALQRMDDAEKAMQKAEETMRNAAPADAAPHLQEAEEKLLALAFQLRALDEKNLAETMGKLSEMAAKAKQRMEEEQKERTEGNAENKPEAGAAAGEKPESSPEAGKTSQDGAGEKPESKAGEGEQKGSSGGKGKESLRQVAEKSETMDDVLKSLAGRMSKEEAEPLNELRNEAGTDSLAPGVWGLAEEKNGAKAGEEAGALAERFGKLSDKLAGEQRRMQQSRLEQLAKALAKTRDLEKTGTTDSKKSEPKGAGESDAEKEGKEGKNGKEGKDGREGKTGKEEGKEPGGSGGEQPKPDAKGKGGGGDQKEGSAVGGMGVGAYLKELQQLQDEVLIRLSRELQGSGLTVSTLKAVEERLNELIDEMLRTNLAKRTADQVPDEYEHLVDEYFRALSDDFGGEEWNSDEAEAATK